MKVYIAAHYSKKEEVKQAVRDLDDLGIEVTSTWHNEKDNPHSHLTDNGRQTNQYRAIRDLAELKAATHLVFFSIGLKKCFTRGGHCYENGAGDILGLKTIVVGERQHIFHHLPGYRIVPTWEKAMVWLKKEKKLDEYATIKSKPNWRDYDNDNSY